MYDYIATVQLKYRSLLSLQNRANVNTYSPPPLQPDPIQIFMRHEILFSLGLLCLFIMHIFKPYYTFL